MCTGEKAQVQVIMNQLVCWPKLGSEMEKVGGNWTHVLGVKPTGFFFCFQHRTLIKYTYSLQLHLNFRASQLSSINTFLSRKFPLLNKQYLTSPVRLEEEIVFLIRSSVP